MNYSLGVWMTDMETGSRGSEGHMSLYLLSVLSVLVAVVFKLAVEIVTALRAAQRLHDQLIRSVMLAPTSWFDATPIGRIINRFSQDIAAVVSL